MMGTKALSLEICFGIQKVPLIYPKNRSLVKGPGGVLFIYRCAQAGSDPVKGGDGRQFAVIFLHLDQNRQGRCGLSDL